MKDLCCDVILENDFHDQHNSLVSNMKKKLMN